MPSSGPAKFQARKMLRTLCNFMLPLVQQAGGKTINMKKIRFGIEADEFVNELENFMSGMILRSRPRSQEVAMEATWIKDNDWVDNFEGTNWLWDIAAPEDETRGGLVSISEVNPGQMPVEQSMVNYYAVLHQNLLEKYLQLNLQDLRRYITQKMPIRLLCFEPHNRKLKISLLDRAGVFNYLAPKLQADYSMGRSWRFDWKVNDTEAGYAILSHTWNQTPGELTYGDWQNGSLDDTHPKCQKLINFCRTAWEDHGLTLGWIDTVCINKESSSELDESIRSMYAWYSNAKVCITYLARTNVLSDMYNDTWFTRGWTFQELVAPNQIKFYNMNWNQLSSAPNDKKDSGIQDIIRFATTITRQELLANIQDTSISRRMQLAAQRQVTREEDIAYCLMGIFNVSISTAYGEGAERAFFRLVEEIFHSTKDVCDIFNWAGERGGRWQPTTSLFPSHPSNYLNCSSNRRLHHWRLIEPLTLTHLGLRTPILLMPAVPILSETSLDCQSIGNYRATVSLKTFSNTFEFQVPQLYHLLDKRFSGPEGLYKAISWWGTKTSTLAFGVLNVEEHGTSIHIPRPCLAVLLQSTVELINHSGDVIEHSPSYSRIYTEMPIVFDLERTGNNSENEDKSNSNDVEDENNSNDEDENNSESNDVEDENKTNDEDENNTNDEDENNTNDEDENNSNDDDGIDFDYKYKSYYELKRSELAQHGMQLVTLYL